MDEPKAASEPFDLTREERAALADMVQSPGWKIVVEKLWPYYRQHILSRLVAGADARDAGAYEGMKQAEVLVASFSLPKTAYAASHTVYEDALMSKNRRTSGSL